MADIQIKADLEAIAKAAAELTASILSQAIADHGQANWLLSGGSAPMGAYCLLASEYIDRVDWSKVVVAIGDERCVPFDSPDASWPLINQTLLKVVRLPENHQLRPKSDMSPEAAAEDYAELLSGLALEGDNVPHFDMVWLGMGGDGHTLSLFPGNPALNDTESLVVAVHDSPKPPPERISLSLKALGNTSNCLVLVTGSEKAEIMSKVLSGGEYPINQAIAAVEAGGGKVTWLLDEAASSFIT